MVSITKGRKSEGQRRLQWGEVINKVVRVSIDVLLEGHLPNDRPLVEWLVNRSVIHFHAPIGALGKWCK